MLAEKHHYSLDFSDGYVTITLKKIGDDTRAKVFKQVCKNPEGIRSHMESLTDVICNEFMKTAQEL